MDTLILMLAGFVVFVLVVAIVAQHLIVIPAPEKKLYEYKRKQFFLSRAEHEFYKALLIAVGSEYFVFAQVHLPTILEHKIPGQNWRGAFRHIDEKSIDFVLCDKAYLSPVLAIELDDKTHARSDRQERDKEVERILTGAGLPLMRFQNHGTFNSQELLLKVRETLSLST